MRHETYCGRLERSLGQTDCVDRRSSRDAARKTWLCFWMACATLAGRAERGRGAQAAKWACHVPRRRWDCDLRPPSALLRYVAGAFEGACGSSLGTSNCESEPGD